MDEDVAVAGFPDFRLADVDGPGVLQRMACLRVPHPSDVEVNLKLTCPHCRKSVDSYVPTGGDGSERMLRKHKCAEGRPSLPGIVGLGLPSSDK